MPGKSYCSIPFERNIFELYALFDVFVHVPIDEHVEAFGQVYVEALAAGIPSIFTLSGIAPEFIKDKENAVVVNFKKEQEIFDALLLVLENTALREKLVFNGKRDVLKQFTLNPMITKLEELYAGN